jgi:uncharacterized protein YjbI with pentapeptide repeats
MALTPLMNLDLPVVGVAGTSGPDWADMLNTALELLDSHDHTSTKGKQIPTAGLNLDADLDFNSLNAIGLRSTRLEEQVALMSDPDDVLCVYTYGGDLYFTNAAGTNVQITSGGSLSLAALGTISGDYSTSTADLTYSDAAKAFTFLQEAGKTAYINSGPISIFENVAGAKYTRLKTPAAQASNLEITLPAALSSTVTLPLVGSTAGVLSFTQIATNMIADDAVTTAKILASNVTTAKIADSNVTTAKIADSNVTTAKIADSNVTTAKIADSNVTTAKIANSNVTAAKMETSINLPGADVKVDSRNVVVSSYQAAVLPISFAGYVGAGFSGSTSGATYGGDGNLGYVDFTFTNAFSATPEVYTGAGFPATGSISNISTTGFRYSDSAGAQTLNAFKVIVAGAK